MSKEKDRQHNGQYQQDDFDFGIESAQYQRRNHKRGNDQRFRHDHIEIDRADKIALLALNQISARRANRFCFDRRFEYGCLAAVRATQHQSTS